MRKLFKFLFILSYALLMANCSDDASENIASFDPDGIAHVNNGDGVDFSQYDEVWIPEYSSTSSAEKTSTQGITNVVWILSKNECFYTKAFLTKNDIMRVELPAPCYIYGENDVYYGGSFSLSKKNDDFYVTTILNKKYDWDTENWEMTPEKKETHKYIVKDSELVFLD